MRRQLMSGVAGLFTYTPMSTLGVSSTSTIKSGLNLQLSFSDFNLSADGTKVVFQFDLGENQVSGLGIYDWRSRTLSRIPNPPQSSLTGASFSRDGRYVAARQIFRLDDHSIVVIDLTNKAIRQLTKPLTFPQYVAYPMFFPDDEHLLFCECRYPHPTGLKVVALQDGRVEEVLPAVDGFFQLMRPSFAKVNEVYFSGVGPSAPAVLADLVSAGLNAGSEVDYRLRFGGSPERLHPHLDANLMNSGHGYDSVSVSGDGKTVIALGLNLKRPERNDHSYNYEVFRIEDFTTPVQLTSVFGYLGLCRVSYDGSTVCFGSRKSRDAPTDLNIFDMASGRVIETDLLRRVQENSDFTN